MSSELDRYLDAFGRDLASAKQPRRRLTPVLGASAVLACVAAAVLGLGLTDSPAGRALDPVAEARAALSPPGEVIYLKIIARTTGVGINVGRQPRGPNTTEQWTTVGPPRWRVVQTSVTPALGLRDETQFSYAGGTQSIYSERRDKLTRREGLSDHGAAAKPVGPLRGDPQSDLRSLLASGRVRDAGLVLVGERKVRRLVSDHRTFSDRRTGGSVTTGFTYDVDSSSFAPIRATLTERFRGRRASDRSSLRTTFLVDRYERLPLNPTTAKLLVIPTTANTKVTVITKVQRKR